MLGLDVAGDNTAPFTRYELRLIEGTSIALTASHNLKSLISQPNNTEKEIINDIGALIIDCIFLYFCFLQFSSVTSINIAYALCSVKYRLCVNYL